MRPSDRHKNVRYLLDVILSEQHRSINDVADDVGSSHVTVYSILKDEIQMSKNSARLGASTAFYRREGDSR